MKARSSLQAQISEVEREITMRHKVYHGLVARRKMREGEAKLYIDRMEDVLATLRFLETHREQFLAMVREKVFVDGSAEI
jgi:hypothetical protein